MIQLRTKQKRLLSIILSALFSQASLSIYTLYIFQLCHTTLGLPSDRNSQGPTLPPSFVLVNIMCILYSLPERLACIPFRLSADSSLLLDFCRPLQNDDTRLCTSFCLYVLFTSLRKLSNYTPICWINWNLGYIYVLMIR